MTVFNAFVLYAVLWFLSLFVVLPLRLTTQGEAGNVVQGTPESAPADAQMKRRLWIATAVSAALFVPIAGVIISGAVSIEDIDFLRRAMEARSG